jgi:MFS transporter, MHS family, shikimate and dehydroshikimate transport protein
MAIDISDSRRNQRRFVVASTLAGATIEWYDFFIFGVISALFLNKLFFPTFDPTTGTILGFMTFATAWLARPIGGMVAGHLGDRVGRKTTLLWSLVLMGAATVMIGLLPTYETAGSVGAILLVLLRIVQGLSAGAEYGGAVVTVVEHAEESKRGLYGSAPQVGSMLGLLLGNATFFLITRLDQAALMSWGWRVPFLMSAIMLFVGIMIRGRMAESPDFVKVKSEGTTERQPLLVLIRHYPRQLVAVLLAQAAPNTFFWMCAVFMVSYAVKTLGVSQSGMLGAVCAGAALEVCTLPLFGILADRVGRRKVFVGGLVFLALFAFPFFLIIQTKDLAWIIVGYAALLGIGHSATFASQASLFAEMFPTAVRYSGLSVAYQASGAIFAGPLPVVATLLIAAQGGALWLFVSYTVLVAVISFFAIMSGLPHHTLLASEVIKENNKRRQAEISI